MSYVMNILKQEFYNHNIQWNVNILIFYLVMF